MRWSFKNMKAGKKLIIVFVAAALMLLIIVPVMSPSTGKSGINTTANHGDDVLEGAAVSELVDVPDIPKTNAEEGLEYIGHGGGDIYEAAFKRLERIQNKKKDQLIEYCNQVRELAESIKNDELMLEFFDVKSRYYRIQQTMEPPPKARHAIAELKAEVEDYYIAHYFTFYDIMFIDKSGDIFYTIKKESNYHNNIFSGKLAQTPLARHLREKPDDEFVDFHYFFPSDEPAAFFVEPAYKGEEHLGWFVLQCAINKVNALFMGDEGLGVTGEVFLVNRDQYMLSDSRFVGDSTVLKMHLDKANIESKFREKAGNKIITDYRGFRALSSFQVFSFLGNEWLIIAKIDEAEIITEYYREHRGKCQKCQEKILKYFADLDIRNGKPLEEDKRVAKVDMDEFGKAIQGECLRTTGVSTCTGIIAAYPGKFGYLAHISPYDRIYDSDRTDLLGHIIKKIKVYDIYKYQRRHVHFVIIANHTESIIPAVRRLTDEGFLLSQIHFLHNPEAKYARITYDYLNDLTCVEWVMNADRSERILQNTCAQNNLGVATKRLLGPET